MAIEVEQKFQCDDLEAVRAALVHRGAHADAIVEQADCYYWHPVRDFAQTDEAFRMRSVGDKNFLTYKGPKLDAVTKTRRELEVGVADGRAAAATCDELLRRLGFEPVAVVRKHREAWRLTVDGTPVEAALDRVERVGEFVELEIQFDEQAKASELAAAQSKLAALAAELGLRNSQRQSYLELLLSIAP